MTDITEKINQRLKIIEKDIEDVEKRLYVDKYARTTIKETEQRLIDCGRLSQLLKEKMFLKKLIREEG